jgi:glutamine amidotransferase
MIGIVDYDINNFRSITSFLTRNEMTFREVRKGNDLTDCEKLILPGVGAFKRGIEKLSELNLIDPIRQFASSGRPILGICLGMQLLFDSSEEDGFSNGLGIIEGKVKSLSGSEKPRVHMGWNNVNIVGKSKILNASQTNIDVYFAHSYHCTPTNSSYVVAECEFGQRIIAAVEKDNIFGLQFHPEKSQEFGKKILESFIRLT